MARSLLALLLLSLGASVAGAQTSVYANVGLTNYGFTNINGSAVTRVGRDTVGIGGGVFYDFPIQSRVTVGVDGRFGYSPGVSGGLLAGAALRFGFVPHRSLFRPYVQLGGGVVHSSYNQDVYGSYPPGGGLETLTRLNKTGGAGQFLVGLDLRLTNRIDLRAPELGSEASGGNGAHPVAAFLNVGLVYHLQPLQR